MITRRELLGGFAAGAASLYSGALAAAGDEYEWFDLEFSLIANGSGLTVSEIGVNDPKPPKNNHEATTEERKVCACWQIPALAFGPDAYFDMRRPVERRPIGKSGAFERTLLVRNAGFGLRKDGVAGFIFSRPEGSKRWLIAYLTNLWIRSTGDPDEVASSKGVSFAEFLRDHPSGDHAPGTKEYDPYEFIAGNRVEASLGKVFDGLIVNDPKVQDKPEPIFRVSLNKDLVWRVRRHGGSRLLVHGARAEVTDLLFGWWRARRSAVASGNQAPNGAPSDWNESPAQDDFIYFAGSTNTAELIDIADGVVLGLPNGHRVSLSPNEIKNRRLDIVVGISPNRPSEQQSVTLLSLGVGAVRVLGADSPLLDELKADSLNLAQTRVVDGGKGGRILWRSTLWDGALSAAGEANPVQPFPVTVATPAGRMVVARQAQAATIKHPDADEMNAKLPSTPEKGKDEDLAACIPGGLALAEAGDKETIRRLFAAAQGDRGGVPEATIFVVAEGLNDDPVRLRRFHADVTLLAADVSLPDTSFSKLSFKRSDLRFAFEDGDPLSGLPFGEKPWPLTPSFVWVGEPRQLPEGEALAALDLSRAELECGRDYDLMKLRFRFDDLVLAFTQGQLPEPRPLIPQIRPSRDEFDVIVADDGTVQDRRPTLVAEFDPQHVLEEAIFRPEPPPLPDVDISDTSITDALKGTKDNILTELGKWPDQSARREFRKGIRELKRAKEVKDEKSTFSDFAMAFEKLPGLAEDQQIYIGPYALDPDAMALARKVQREVGAAAIRADVESMLTRIEGLAAVEARLNSDGRIRLPLDQNAPWLEALRNETVLESIEPLYGVFRSFWRDRISRYNSLRQRRVDLKVAAKEFDLAIDASIDPADWHFLSEYLTHPNRFDGYYWPKGGHSAASDAAFANLRSSIVASFINFATGQEQVESLMGARLSGRSRLAFRLNGEPDPETSIYDAGLEEAAPSGPAKPGAGNPRFKAIPYTFEALTDWSRHEPAVTPRARKLYSALPSGRLPPVGSRASNPSDTEMLRFQGFTGGQVTGEQRMAEVRASLQSQRRALAIVTDTPVPQKPEEASGSPEPANGADNPRKNGGGATQQATDADVVRIFPFPGEPLDLETSIELPARLMLSTAQDAVWRTNRRLPSSLFGPEARTGTPAAQPGPPEEPQLEEGLAPENPEGPISVSPVPRDLWSVRLDISVQPSVRAVASPDLRTSALGRPTGPNGIRLPGQGAPPRGPLAPWFIGPEQMESGTLTVDQVCKALPEPVGPEDCIPPPPGMPARNKLLGWLFRRSDELKEEGDLAIFRTSLDAFDRHQIVLLTSAYGLPVIGKRLPKPGADGESEGGALVSGSGQIEPGDAFSLIDATNDQAIHRPVPLNVKELSLTGLGGSLLHETAFKPSAGADDIFGKKIFEGFSIDTLQQDIVLGRDIRTEVVYKGYLLPLGHKASFVKLTERIFLRTQGYGVKAILRQRMFIRMAEPVKLYGAIGQPHMGRLWPAKVVQLLSDKTPDILDPTLTPPEEVESPTGRIGLNNGPGLAFWPKTDLTASGRYRFPVAIDGAPTSLPMLFLDNIAATTAESLEAAVTYYNREVPDLRERRILTMSGRKVDYAPNSKAGEAQFETEELHIYAHGRLDSLGSDWRGSLNRYNTTGILEGAGQPPFYPALDFARIRIGSVERMSGGKAMPVEVEYDGHYVRYGFTDDPQPRGEIRPGPEKPDGNPLNIFLNLRTVLPMTMGGNGDRSGGMARPESFIIALSRDKGPMGGDETAWWQTEPKEPHPERAKEWQNGRPPDRPQLKNFRLTSLARYFNEEAKRPEPANDRPPPSPAIAPTAKKSQRLIAQVQSFFSPSAKLLGTISFKDLMMLMGVDASSVPLLKETLEYGTAAADATDEALGGAATDVRTRVLLPLNNVVRRLRHEWNDLDDTIERKLGKKNEKAGLEDLYPEVDQSLSNLETSLAAALATDDTLTLALSLNDVKRSADGVIRVLRILAANAVERLEDAVSQGINDRIAALTGAFDTYRQQIAAIGDRLPALVAERVADAVIDSAYAPLPSLARAETREARFEALILELLVVPNLPPDIAAIAQGLGATVDTFVAEVRQAVEDFQAELLSRLQQKGDSNPLWVLVRDSVASVLSGSNFAATLPALLKSFEEETKSVVYGAINEPDSKGLINDPKLGLLPKIRELQRKYRPLVGSSVDYDTAVALGVIIEVHAKSYAEEAMDAAVGSLIDRYPAETQRLIAGLTFANKAVDAVRALTIAANAGDPKSFLVAGSALIAQVLGIDLAAWTDLEAKIRAGIDEAFLQVFASQPWSAAGAVGAFGDPAALRAELAAVAAYRGDPSDPSAKPDPTAIPKQLPATSSNEVLEAIRMIIGALESLIDPIEGPISKAASAISTHAGEIDNLPDAGGLRPRAVDLAYFLSSLGDAIHNPVAETGLIEDFKELYVDIVLFVGAARDLQAIGGATRSSGALLDHITARAELMRRLGDSIGQRLGAVAHTIEKFATDRENRQVIVFIGASGALWIPFATIANRLKAGPTKEAIEELTDKFRTEEAKVAGALAGLLNGAFRLTSFAAVGAQDAIRTIIEAGQTLNQAAAGYGFSLDPEMAAFSVSLEALRERLNEYEKLAITPLPDSLKVLLDFQILPKSNVLQLLRHPGNAVAGGSISELEGSLASTRALECAVVRELGKLQLRIKGAPAELKKAALQWLYEQSVLGTGIDLFETLNEVYSKVKVARDKLLTDSTNIPLIASGAYKALIVQTTEVLPPASAECPVGADDPSRDCDRLAQEVAFLKRLAALDVAELIGTPEQMTQLAVFFASWQDSSAAPFKILDQAKDIAREILSGDLLAFIDFSSFRDMLEEAVSGLIPTKYSYRYDFQAYIDASSDDKMAIFQPRLGSAFTVMVRASLNLFNGEPDFSATASIGPFQIFLIGGLVDAIRLKFGGAVFTARTHAKPKLDIAYDDFEIGKDLEFAQKLQAYLTPKEGSGPFIQPLARAAGIEAGYGINLGTINVGPTAFFNVSLNVSAELPFDESEALFKVSLGRRLSPFTISVPPYAGSGFFSIFAAADGVRGFEASFEFGGGGAIAFGPLIGQGRLQVGVFIRILRVNGVRTTSMYGTFFAGGSASIWVFHFGCSLYVRLGSAGDGAMYGEAVFTFSFSIGLADFDYSVSVMHKENPIGTGSGSGKQATLEAEYPRRTRYAGIEEPTAIRQPVELAYAEMDASGVGRSRANGNRTIVDAAALIVTAAASGATTTSGGGAEGKGSWTIVVAAGPNYGWSNYLGYFDFDLLVGVKL